MPHRSIEALVEESVARLDAISQRRNVLLREMHQMIKRRDDLGSVLTFEAEDEGDLQIFLQRFNMTRDEYATVSLDILLRILTHCKALRQVAYIVSAKTNCLPLHLVKTLMS